MNVDVHVSYRSVQSKVFGGTKQTVERISFGSSNGDISRYLDDSNISRILDY